jgi:hypothetical protein
VQEPVRQASAIGPEIANLLNCYERKRKYVQNKMKAYYLEKKIMFSAKVPGQYPTICVIFDPP